MPLDKPAQKLNAFSALHILQPDHPQPSCIQFAVVRTYPDTLNAFLAGAVQNPQRSIHFRFHIILPLYVDIAIRLLFFQMPDALRLVIGAALVLSAATAMLP